MIRELEFKILSRRHCDDIFRYARSLLGNAADAEDATQEVLLRVWQNLPRINLFNTRAWILRTTRNYCLDQIRKRSNKHALVTVPDDMLNDYPDDFAASPDLGSDTDYLRKQIGQALEQLPENHRSVFVLYEINGLPYREISATMEIPINSVKVYLSRARQRLKQILTEDKSWMSTYEN